MHASIVSLASLHEYARKDPKGEALQGTSGAGREYTKLAVQATAEVANESGFYLWGKYESSGLWQNIYLGKAGFGKSANLRARIVEELRDERCVLWAPPVLSEETVLELGAKFYRQMWHQYGVGWRRSLKKAGSTFIVWVAANLDNAEVRSVESDLIETLNPQANLQRPAPPAALQSHTRDVIALFREMIHASRPIQVRKGVLTNTAATGSRLNPLTAGIP